MLQAISEAFLRHSYLDGGFKYFLFSALPREASHFDEYFSDGLVQPPTRYIYTAFLRKNETCNLFGLKLIGLERNEFANMLK